MEIVMGLTMGINYPHHYTFLPRNSKCLLYVFSFLFFLFLNRSTRWWLRERRKPKDCWIKGDFKGMEGKTSWILKGLIKTDGRISQPEGRGKLSQNTSEVGASSPLLSGSLSVASLQADSSSWLMRKERRVVCVCVWGMVCVCGHMHVCVIIYMPDTRINIVEMTF